MNKHSLNALYTKGIRWWLTWVLLFLPFQYRIVESIKLWNPVLANYLNKLEEITIVVFLPLAIIQFIINKDKYNYKYLILSVPFIVCFASGLISGIVRGNSLLITVHGSFDYIKYFLVIFIYAAFFKELADYKKVFNLLLMMAVFLGVVAFIQEIWAVVSRYLLGKDIADYSIYILHDLGGRRWRFGIYRAPSFMGHYNIIGLYSLMMLTIYMSMLKKINYVVFLSLFAGIFVSVSRMIYTGFMLVAGFQILKKRWIALILAVPIAIMLYYMSFLPDFNISNEIKAKVADFTTGTSLSVLDEDQSSDLDQIVYRIVARDKGLEVWKDHPLWGVGPGMFGSAVAYKYRSPVYEEYNFTTVFRWIKSLDQFWPQVLAETGLIGTSAFAGLLLVLFIVFAVSARETTSDEIRGFFIGLMTFMVVLNIYSMGGTFNHPVILVTYSALAGMALGCKESVTLNSGIEAE